MPSTTGEFPRLPLERDRQPAAVIDEPRPFGGSGIRLAAPCPSPHAGFDADLNPIDDELINTRGSER
jgi:hypothetical protein